MNKAILMGRLTKDPELRSTQSGVSVASFTLAIDRRFKNAQGERETDFIPCVAWRQTAEFINQYFSKGHKMAVVGSIQTRNYENDEGRRIYVTEINVDEAYFVESRKGAGQSGSTANAYKSYDDDDASLPFDL